MTTIAACLIRRVMVADSQWSDGTRCGGARKVHRCGGALIGLAGDFASMQMWFEKLRDGTLERGDGDLIDVEALRLCDAGLSHWTALDGWTPLTEKRWAIGSGADYAIGALMAGATPLKAVRIAITHDAGSGGKARTYRLTARR